MKVVDELGQNLFSGAVNHWFFYKISNRIRIQTVPPKYGRIIALCFKMRLGRYHNRHSPRRIFKGHQCATSGFVTAILLNQLKHFVALESRGKRIPFGLIRFGKKRIGITEFARFFVGYFTPQCKTWRIARKVFCGCFVIAIVGIVRNAAVGKKYQIAFVYRNFFSISFSVFTYNFRNGNAVALFEIEVGNGFS